LLGSNGCGVLTEGPDDDSMERREVGREEGRKGVGVGVTVRKDEGGWRPIDMRGRGADADNRVREDWVKVMLARGARAEKGGKGRAGSGERARGVPGLPRGKGIGTCEREPGIGRGDGDGTNMSTCRGGVCFGTGIREVVAREMADTPDMELGVGLAARGRP
jgi:hypothetical protein